MTVVNSDKKNPTRFKRIPIMINDNNISSKYTAYSAL
jgi:hypothetical protein